MAKFLTTFLIPISQAYSDKQHNILQSKLMFHILQPIQYERYQIMTYTTENKNDTRDSSLDASISTLQVSLAFKLMNVVLLNAMLDPCKAQPFLMRAQSSNMTAISFYLAEH